MVGFFEVLFIAWICSLWKVAFRKFVLTTKIEKKTWTTTIKSLFSFIWAPKPVIARLNSIPISVCWLIYADLGEFKEACDGMKIFDTCCRSIHLMSFDEVCFGKITRYLPSRIFFVYLGWSGDSKHLTNLTQNTLAPLAPTPTQPQVKTDPLWYWRGKHYTT